VKTHISSGKYSIDNKTDGANFINGNCGPLFYSSLGPSPI